MYLFIRKEKPGQYSVNYFPTKDGPATTLCIFKKRVDAERMVDAAARAINPDNAA